MGNIFIFISAFHSFVRIDSEMNEGTKLDSYKEWLFKCCGKPMKTYNVVPTPIVILFKIKMNEFNFCWGLLYKFILYVNRVQSECILQLNFDETWNIHEKVTSSTLKCFSMVIHKTKCDIEFKVL